MTSNKTEILDSIFFNNRYESHKDIITSDKIPILKKNRDYIIIWGYWNGLMRNWLLKMEIIMGE